MALKVFRTGAEEYGRWMKVLLAGEPGAGKTRSSSTWTNPFFASAEGGLMSVHDRSVPATKISSLADIDQLRKILAQPAKVREDMLGVPVDSVIVDTLDEVQRIIIKERLADKRTESLATGDWGYVGDTLRGIVRGFRNLDMNVVFCCHVKEVTDAETGRVTLRPALQGAMGDELAAYVDLALLLTARPMNRIRNGETVREIVRVAQTYPDTRVPWCKDRSGRLPYEFEINLDDDYKRLYDSVFGGLGEGLDHSTVIREAVDVLAEAQAPKTVEPAKPPAKAAAATKKAAAKKEPEPVPQGAPPAPVEPSQPALEPQPQPAPEPAADAGDTADSPPDTPPAAEQPGPITQPEPIQQPAAEPAPAKQEGGKCADCGGDLDDLNISDFSFIRFRRNLCTACFKVAKAPAK